MLRNRGHLRVYGDIATGRFLGAEMAGPDAEHIAHLLAWALQAELTVADMLAMPFYHPVIEEGLRTALRDLDAQINAGNRSAKTDRLSVTIMSTPEDKNPSAVAGSFTV